jgi:hypothetical protein
MIIAYYQSASTKAVAAQCDKTKKVCQIQSETTHFGGYFPVYSYYYLPFPLYGPGLGIYYPGSIINTPSMCDNCLNKITPQDEQDIQNSKAPVSQSDLPSDQQAAPSSQPESNPNPSGSANPAEQTPPSENSPSPESSGSGSGSGQSGGGSSGGGGDAGGGSSGGGGDAGGGSSGGGGDAGGGSSGGGGGGEGG